ncbi:MAG: hypothetical protein JKX85_05540 [Phycisphaeraceae bacterium]|nr:hypothetical protein [Phycisphaeraceae bacterium]
MDNRRTRRRNVRRFIAYSIVILIALLTATAAWGVYLWQHTPQYWTDNQTFLQSRTAQEINQIAMDAENQVLNLLSLSVQTDDSSQEPVEKQLGLNTHQINAWLNQRLPAWSRNQNIQLPSEIKNVMMHTENGRFAVAFEYHKNDMHKIVTLVFDVTMISKGKAMFHLTRIRAGSLPSKPSWLINNITDSTLKKLATEIIQGKITELKFPHPADDQRTLMINKLTIHNNGIIADVLTQ